MINFDKNYCPRCQRRWTDIYYKYPECECGLRVSGINVGNSEEDTYITNMTISVGHYFVYWYRRGESMVGTYEKDPRIPMPVIPLPFLPYDITEEQIELYLTFS